METKPNPSYCSAFYKITAAIGLSIVASLGLLSFVSAEPIHTRLNPDLPEGASIGWYTGSPDGAFVAYIADQEKVGVKEVYAIPLRGGTPIRLNPPLVEGGDVYDMRISPDSSRIVYNAKQESTSYAALYSVSPSGENVVNISGVPPAGAGVWKYQISPDNKWVIFNYVREKFNEFGLMSTPIDRNEPVSLLPPALADSYADGYLFTPDFQQIVYRTEDNGENKSALYRVPVHGGTPVTLSVPLSSSAFIAYHRLSLDGTRVIYGVRSGPTMQVYSTPLSGGASIPLGQPHGSIEIADLSPDGSRVLLISNDSNPNNSALYSAPVQGGEASLLHSTGESGYIYQAKFVNDGKDILFISRGFNSTYDIHQMAAVEGSTPQLLKSGFASSLYMELTPDKKKAITTFSNFGGQKGFLLLTDISSSTTTTLTTSSSYNSPVFDPSPDNTSLVYAAKPDENTPLQLFSASLQDGTSAKLSIDSTFDTSDLFTTPVVNGGQICVVYHLETDLIKPRELYSSCYDTKWSNQTFLPLITR